MSGELSGRTSGQAGFLRPMTSTRDSVMWGRPALEMLCEADCTASWLAAPVPIQASDSTQVMTTAVRPRTCVDTSGAGAADRAVAVFILGSLERVFRCDGVNVGGALPNYQRVATNCTRAR